MNAPPLQDEFFGTLQWDERVNWYETKMTFPDGLRVSVSIPVEGEPAPTAIRRARSVFPTIQSREPEYREAATTQLLDLHNDTWNEGDEIDAATFKSRMSLESIVIYPSGGAEIYYGDGDLFWGHTILVGLTEDLSFRDATIAG
jgi:hypothetical protein